MTDLDGAVTINESGADADFRVESDGNTSALFVDAGNDKVTTGVRFDFADLLIGTGAGKYIQVTGGSSNALAIGMDGGTAAPGTAATSVGFHHWNNSSWSNVMNVTRDGLAFGTDTATANSLDDYEEGAWTPDIKINDSTTGIAYTARSADFVKIGKLVFVNGDIQLSDKGSSSGSVIISGLPFTVTDRTSATSIDGGASLCAHSSGTSNLYTPIGLTGVGGATYINMYFAASSGATMASNLTDSKITDAFSIRFSLTYTAA